MRIVTYNVHGCRGMDGRLAPERIADVIAATRADIACLQELDVRRARSGHVHQAEVVARALSMQFHFFPAIRAATEEYGDGLSYCIGAEVVNAWQIFPSDPSRERDPGVMDTTPHWLTESGRTYPSLDRDLDVDVLVIGGGITGVTAAYLLKQGGCKIALVERGTLGSGETGHTTAHLTFVTDLRLTKLVRNFGRDHAQAAWDAGQFAVAEIFRLTDRESIDCGLRRVPAYLFAALGVDASKEAEELHREAHLAAELGFDADYLEHVPTVDRPGICFANQAEVHPIRYLRGLGAAVDGGGSFVFENSAAGEFEESPRRMKVNGHTVRFERCVIATHVPLQGGSTTLAAMLRQTKLAAYSTYAVAGPVPKGRYPQALFWDTSDPYLYARFHAREDDDYVVVGNNDRKTGQADAERDFQRLRHVAQTFVPEASFDRRWSGQVIETVDGLPLIGETAPGEFVATGFAGNGMTFGTLLSIPKQLHIRKLSGWL